MLINGQWTKIPAGKTDTTFIEILAPYDGKVIGAIPEASPEDVGNAISAAENAFRENRLTPYKRYEILSTTAHLLEERKDKIAATLALEAGKPIRDARA